MQIKSIYDVRHPWRHLVLHDLEGDFEVNDSIIRSAIARDLPSYRVVQRMTDPLVVVYDKSFYRDETGTPVVVSVR